MKKQFAAEYKELEQWHWWFQGRQRILETVLGREIPTRKPIKLASVGCGPAEGLRWLEPFVGKGGKVVGIDLEPLHARILPPAIEYIIGSLESAPVADGSFDVVLALDVLEHLDHDSKGLKEAARMVRPGGLLLVTVPALPSLWGSQDVVSHHRRRYTKRTLLDVYDRSGLPSPRVTYFNTFLFPLAAGVRWTRRALGTADRARSDFDDAQPGLVNDLLESVFAAERRVIPHVNFPIGVSLLATTTIPASR